MAADDFTKVNPTAQAGSPKPKPGTEAKSPVPVAVVPGQAQADLNDLLTRLIVEVWALRKVTCEQNGWPFIDYTGPFNQSGG